ncbi:hypothetical protein CLF_100790, partial [Clonorchis sinensis]
MAKRRRSADVSYHVEQKLTAMLCESVWCSKSSDGYIYRRRMRSGNEEKKLTLVWFLSVRVRLRAPVTR